MTEDIYAKPDLSKKNRFQTGVKEDKNTDAYDDIDDVRIYDNYCAPQSTPPETSQDNTTEDQQQTASVKRSVFGAAAVLLGLLCLLLLVAVIILVVLYILERNRLWGENANLKSERDKLRTSYSEMNDRNHNLTLKTNQLENEKDLLKATNNNLTEERDELQKLVNESTCPNKWTRFGNSCYLKSTSRENWNVSNQVCQGYDAQLVIISSEEEQTADILTCRSVKGTGVTNNINDASVQVFLVDPVTVNQHAQLMTLKLPQLNKCISSLFEPTWIGLTDEESEAVWKWVDGTTPNKTYWRANQPDNYHTENCAHISSSSTKNWNDLRCDSKMHFTCEKVLK